MRGKLFVMALTAVAMIVLGACQSDEGSPTGPGAAAETDAITYGVWGYVMSQSGNPVVGHRVKIVCSCGIWPNGWVSAPTDKTGYWEVSFTAAEARQHNGHAMAAIDIDYPSLPQPSTPFTFYAAVTGPVYIYTP